MPQKFLLHAVIKLKALGTVNYSRVMVYLWYNSKKRFKHFNNKIFLYIYFSHFTKLKNYTNFFLVFKKSPKNVCTDMLRWIQQKHPTDVFNIHDILKNIYIWHKVKKEPLHEYLSMLADFIWKKNQIIFNIDICFIFILLI